MKKISKITPADVRKLWPNEERDFTPWLMRQFSELTEKIDIHATNVRREEPTGDFRVDLVAEELKSGRKIIVENQLETTNHAHFGQLLTYAGGHDAKIVIWVSTNFRKEHKQALSWLNIICSREIAFFGIELRVITGKAENLFEFIVVVQPDEWNPKREAYSKKNQKYSEFNATLLSDLRKQNLTNATKGNPDTWQNIAAGSSKVFFETRFGNDNRFRVSFTIKTPKQNKKIFDSLFMMKDSIENTFGAELEWERRDTQLHSVIAVYRDATINADRQSLDSLRMWAVDQIIRLKKALAPHSGIWK